LFVEKSSRHQKIIGNFGEQLICNWLSRSGFEVSIVDHTGIDIVAFNPKTNLRLGITVKSRTRNIGKEKSGVNLFDVDEGRRKIIDACNSFACEPWIGVYVETAEYADLFLTSLNHYEHTYYTKSKVASWKMGPDHIKNYDNDEKVMHLEISFQPKNWFVITI
jgi:hypothetical protein